MIALVLASLLATVPLADSDDLFDPGRDGERISVEGIVRDARISESGTLVVDVCRNASRFTVTARADESSFAEFASALPDATIRANGILDIVPDNASSLGIAAIVRLQTLGDITILEAPPADPFDAPEADFSAYREGYEALERHRVKARGTVIYSCESGERFFLMKLDADIPIEVRCARDQRLPRRAERVEVAGFVANAWNSPRLEEAHVRLLGEDSSRIPAPRKLSIKELSELIHSAGEDGVEDVFATEVELEGVVAEISRRASDRILTLQEGGESVSLVIADTAEELPEIHSRISAAGYVVFGGARDAICVYLRDASAMAVIEKPPFWTPRRFSLLFGALVLVAVVLVILVRKNEQTKAHATLAERMRLAGDLHDGLQQLLAAARFRLDAAKSNTRTDDLAQKEHLGAAEKALLSAQTGLRAILWGLQEEEEGSATLAGLFRHAAERMPHWNGIVEIRQEGIEPGWARNLGGALLMILHEAVGNAISHGGADEISVVLAYPRKGGLILRVADNGSGFDTSRQYPGHMGLYSLQSRAKELGGALKIISTPGTGTSVVVRIKGR